MQAAGVKAVGHADEIHFQRQLPHLVDRQRDVGGIAVHRGVLRGDGVAVLVPQLQRGGRGGGVGQRVVAQHRGHHLADLIQLTGGAAQRDLSGNSGGLVQHIAVGDRDSRGIHRDGHGLFADFIEHDVDRIVGFFHCTLDVAGVIGGIGHAGLQAQGDLACTADAGIAGIDHDVGAGHLTNAGDVALDPHGYAADVGPLHNVQALVGVGSGGVGVVDGHIPDGGAALGIDVDGNDQPGSQAAGQRHQDGNYAVIHQGFAPLGCVIRLWHGVRSLLFAAVFSARIRCLPRSPQAGRPPPARG